MNLHLIHFGHFESLPNDIWSMVNLKRKCVLLFYYFVHLKVNLEKKKQNKTKTKQKQKQTKSKKQKQISLVNLHPTLFSWPNCFGKEVYWWCILTQRFCLKGEHWWRLEVGTIKMPFDTCIKTATKISPILWLLFG